MAFGDRFHRLPHRVLLPAHRLQRDFGIPLLISLPNFWLFSIGMEVSQQIILNE
jgi:hypothetical protein